MPAAAERGETSGAAAIRYAIVFLVSLCILTIGISASSNKEDEIYYVGAARNFIAGTASVNPEHPPFAKYLIALSIEVLGDRPLGWRFPSAVAGAGLLLSASFGLTLRLTRSLHSAYITSWLIAANGFWFTMSRIANLSIFELAFEAAAVWVFVKAIEEREPRLFACSGALFGLSVASRWCGVVGLAVCAAHALVYYRPIIKSLALTAGSALTVYVGSWVPLIVREHRNAFYLFTANAYILQFHRHATTDLRPGEPWWTWIFRLDLQEAPMELIANPVIGILGLVAITVLLWRRKPLLPALYIAHILQWAVVSYHWSHYYYYLEAFTWLTVALAVSMQDVKIGRVRLDIIVAACALGAVAWPFWKAMQ